MALAITPTPADRLHRHRRRAEPLWAGSYASYTTLYEPGVISHQYLSYLYCDRAVYRTTDTIQVWAWWRPRHDGVEAPNPSPFPYPFLGEDL